MRPLNCGTYSKRGPVTDFSEAQDVEIRQREIYRYYNTLNYKMELLNNFIILCFQ